MTPIGLFLLLGVLSQGSPQAAPTPDILVSGDWLEMNLGRPDLVILQASSNGEDYAAGHIPGARLVLLDQIAWEGERGAGVEFRSVEEIRTALEAAGVSDESTVVVYGASPLLAARLWTTLDVTGASAGMPLFLDGGTQLWTEEGRPWTQDVPVVSRGRLTAQLEPERLATADWILAHLGWDDLTLMDARSTSEYEGEDGDSGADVRNGHIPGAHLLNWERLIESRDRPKFLGRDELAYLFKRVGADPGDTVVTYCVTGLRAGVDYMIARMLGYEVRLYDGSWRDWESRGYPVRPRIAG